MHLVVATIAGVEVAVKTTNKPEEAKNLLKHQYANTGVRISVQPLNA